MALNWCSRLPSALFGLSDAGGDVARDCNFDGCGDLGRDKNFKRCWFMSLWGCTGLSGCDGLFGCDGAAPRKFNCLTVDAVACTTACELVASGLCEAAAFGLGFSGVPSRVEADTASRSCCTSARIFCISLGLVGVSSNGWRAGVEEPLATAGVTGDVGDVVKQDPSTELCRSCWMATSICWTSLAFFLRCWRSAFRRRSNSVQKEAFAASALVLSVVLLSSGNEPDEPPSNWLAKPSVLPSCGHEPGTDGISDLGTNGAAGLGSDGNSVAILRPLRKKTHETAGKWHERG